MKKQFIHSAVFAAAVLMMTTFPQTAGLVYAQEAQSIRGWSQDDGGWRFYDNNGYYVTDVWKKTDGNWFYLGEDGYVAYQQMIDEYYVNDKGHRVTDFWMAADHEADWDMADSPEQYWYYFGRDGRALTSNWLKQGDKWYYFDEESHMVTGLVSIGDSRYYFGTEEDGAMKTGWFLLHDSALHPDSEAGWYYFDRSGKMIENATDWKIDGSFYSFLDGKMQTGWLKVPQEATSSNALSMKDYEYYMESGKRADGWLDLEGPEEFREDDETHRYYFKNGRAHASDSGIMIYTVNGQKYGFNSLGHMQTGQQIVTLEDGSTANYYFATDGMMKTGKQVISNEDTDQNETWFFYTDGSRKGQGFHGIRDNSIYQYGKRLEADSDLRYAPVSFEEKRYLVNTSGAIQKAASSSRSSQKPELGNGYKDIKDSNDTIWTVNIEGVIQN